MAARIALAAAATFVAGDGQASVRGSFDRAPFYAGPAPAAGRAFAHAPVRFVTETGSLDPDPKRSPALAALVDSLNAELDRMGLSSHRPLDRKGGPVIRFGCVRGDDAGVTQPSDECDPTEPRRMRFAIEEPNRGWRDRWVALAGDSLDGVLVIQLSFGSYWVRSQGWRNDKSIEIGTARSQPVAWLTSLDDPVQVLQLTGAVVTAKGKVGRVGAEGLLARRTGLIASALGAREVLAEDELGGLLASEGNVPPVWRAALWDLVRGLTRAEPGAR
jgi:hypothetical protein